MWLLRWWESLTSRRIMSIHYDRERSRQYYPLFICLCAYLLDWYGPYSGHAGGPTTTNFDGTKLTEAVTPFSNSCPTTIPHLQNNYVCTGSTTFTIGLGVGTVASGIVVPDIHNQIWDDHEALDGASRLANSGVQSCTIVCAQTYSCGGKPVANFKISRQFTQGTSGGYAVTSVYATKQ